MLKIVLSFLFMSLAFMAQAIEKEASRLVKDLTPVGAERIGNGSDIPSWTGGLPQSKGHKSGAFHSNPYFRETPLFAINQTNMAEHKDRLSLGS
jgi:hypothetical protein